MQSGARKQSVLADSPSGRLRLRIAAEPSYLSRLAAVYAYPIRYTIVAELYRREMSPTQFFETFGGGSVSRVRRHFKELEAHGWLRKVRVDPSGPGRPQHMYRTTETATIDDETWAELPFSMRTWFSWRTLAQISRRARWAIEAGTLDSRPDRHVSCECLVLDERGWQERIKAMNQCFWTLGQEQVDAKIRLQESGERPIVAIVALAGFESPAAGKEDAAACGRGSLHSAHTGGPSGFPYFTKSAKVFADPLMLKIVTELNRTAMSATQLAERIGGAAVYGFDRRCKILVKLGWLEHAGTKTGGRRRGATEHFYRAAAPLVHETDLWRPATGPRARQRSQEALRMVFARATEALRAGTFDERPERHLSWWPLRLDEQGWRQVMQRLEECSRSIRAAGDHAAKETATRARETRGSVAATFFLAGFEAAWSTDELWTH